jgi:hypothetical protein
MWKTRRVRSSLVAVLLGCLVAGATTRADDYSETLAPNESLQIYTWDRLVSANEQHWLEWGYREDLQTVFLRTWQSGYGETWSSLWDGGSTGIGNHVDQWQYDNGGGNYALMQGDGNFVLYYGYSAIWATNTHDNPDAYLKMQDDGNLVVYSDTHSALWAVF